MTDNELQRLQRSFEAQHGPLLAAIADTMGGMIGQRDVVSLAMFNEALKSMAIHAAEELRGMDKEQPVGPGAGARLMPGCKPFFIN